MPTNRIIHLESKSLKYTGVTIDNPFQREIKKGVTVVIGPNGSGKSTLALIIERGRNFATNRITISKPNLKVRTIEFGDIHSLSGFKAEYYQQRYEATMNDEVPTVGELFTTRTNTDLWRKMTHELHLVGIAEKKVNFLSSGELRKMLIVNMLFDLPDLLILDNPYIGLDTAGRESIDHALQTIAAGGTAIMMLLCDPDDIPEYADDVIVMDKLRILPEGYDMNDLFTEQLHGEIPAPEIPHKRDGKEVFSFDRCPVTHCGRVLLPEVTWTVEQGECWSLSGPNGSGKSTLLSLIYADNPQAYARPISLFGRKRGSGETIWDIKRRIGYISSEMHLYFNGGHNKVRDVVAQGLNDTVGMFKKLTPEQTETAMKWLKLFRLEDMADRRFSTLSTGEQRLALLARTLIKNPELLILDEPLHGLDASRKKEAIKVVDTLCRRDASTLVFVTHCPEEIPTCVNKHFSLKKAD